MIKMHVPWLPGAQTIIGSNGAAVSPDANGVISISEDDLIALLKIGARLSTAMPFMRRTTLANAANSTIPANAIAFGQHIILVVSGGTALTHTVDVAANMIALIPDAKLLDTWWVRIINTNSGNLTIANATGVTLNGTVVMATNRYIDFLAQYTAANAITLTNVGFGNAT